MPNVLLQFVSQLISQSPLLLVYLVGIILAVVNLGRYPRPAWYALIASTLFFATALAVPLLNVYFFQARNDVGLPPNNLTWMIAVIGITSTIVRAGAFGLLLAAVFSGRKGNQLAEQDSTYPSAALGSNPYATNPFAK